jgi:hypothetical protein
MILDGLVLMGDGYYGDDLLLWLCNYELIFKYEKKKQSYLEFKRAQKIIKGILICRVLF